MRCSSCAYRASKFTGASISAGNEPRTTRVVDGFTSVREQDVRAERTEGVAHCAVVQALDQEDTGLLHFNDEGNFVAIVDGHGQGQYDFVEIAFQLLLTGIEVQADGRRPLLAEDRRAFGASNDRSRT